MKSKDGFLKWQKIDNLLAMLTRKKRERAQIVDIRNRRGDINHYKSHGH